MAIIDTAKGKINDADPDRLADLQEVASTRIEQYAPNAPDIIKAEAATRYVGYMLESGTGAIRKKDYADPLPLDLDQVTSREIVVSPGAFRNSGAESLLSPWKKRRAGAIG